MIQRITRDRVRGLRFAEWRVLRKIEIEVLRLRRRRVQMGIVEGACGEEMRAVGVRCEVFGWMGVMSLVEGIRR